MQTTHQKQRQKTLLN